VGCPAGSICILHPVRIFPFHRRDFKQSTDFKFSYGIEGIAQTYEDPFGVAKIDINMDDIVEDARREVEVLLTAWQTQGQGNGGIFRPRVASQMGTPRSDDSSEIYNGEISLGDENRNRSQVRFVVSDLTENAYKDDEPMEIGNIRASRLASAASPGTTPMSTSGSDYFHPT
jgi:putative membrane protein